MPIAAPVVATPFTKEERDAILNKTPASFEEAVDYLRARLEAESAADRDVRERQKKENDAQSNIDLARTYLNGGAFRLAEKDLSGLTNEEVQARESKAETAYATYQQDVLKETGYSAENVAQKLRLSSSFLHLRDVGFDEKDPAVSAKEAVRTVQQEEHRTVTALALLQRGQREADSGNPEAVNRFITTPGVGEVLVGYAETLDAYSTGKLIAGLDPQEGQQAHYTDHYNPATGDYTLTRINADGSVTPEINQALIQEHYQRAVAEGRIHPPQQGAENKQAQDKGPSQQQKGPGAGSEAETEQHPGVAGAILAGIGTGLAIGLTAKVLGETAGILARVVEAGGATYYFMRQAPNSTQAQYVTFKPGAGPEGQDRLTATAGMNRATAHQFLLVAAEKGWDGIRLVTNWALEDKIQLYLAAQTFRMDEVSHLVQSGRLLPDDPKLKDFLNQGEVQRPIVIEDLKSPNGTFDPALMAEAVFPATQELVAQFRSIGYDKEAQLAKTKQEWDGTYTGEEIAALAQEMRNQTANRLKGLLDGQQAENNTKNEPSQLQQIEADLHRAAVKPRRSRWWPFGAKERAEEKDQTDEKETAPNAEQRQKKNQKKYQGPHM